MFTYSKLPQGKPVEKTDNEIHPELSERASTICHMHDLPFSQCKECHVPPKFCDADYFNWLASHDE